MTGTHSYLRPYLRRHHQTSILSNVAINSENFFNLALLAASTINVTTTITCYAES